MKKIIKNFARAIKRILTHKQRFLYACAFKFYYDSSKNTNIGDVTLLPFVSEKNRFEWAKAKAKDFLAQAIKEKTVAVRYKKALQYVKAQG